MHNLFEYCNGSPIFSVDYLGTDAIILQSKESVFKFGHMGLLLQYDKSWYYWYWGMDGIIAGLQYAITALRGLGAACIAATAGSVAIVLAMLTFTITRTLTKNVRAKSTLKKICAKNKITHTATLSNINAKLDNADVGYSEYFEKGLFLRGDFSKSYKYLKKQKALHTYNLIYNNCMQTSISALYRGKFNSNNTKNRLRLVLARNFIVPNFAYDYLKKYYTSLMESERRN